MLMKIKEYFNNIGVDISFSKYDNGLLVEFKIGFEMIDVPIELTIDTKESLLMLTIKIENIIDISNNIFTAMNLLNMESILLKSFYNKATEEIFIVSNLIYNDDNLINIINNILNTIISKDVNLIENLYNTIMEDDDLEAIGDFLDIDDYFNF